MASRNIARLGVVLGLDTAEWTTSIDKAISDNKKLSRNIKSDSDAAAKEILRLKYATEDYGKALTQVEIIQREMQGGRYANATKELTDRLLAQAKAYDAITTSSKKAGFTMNEQQKLALAYQTTDLFTQIASGGNPLIAIMQQGGQLKDQMGGLNNMFKAIGQSLFTVKGLFFGVAAGAAAVGFAAYKGASEVSALRDALIQTNNYAGLTQGSFRELATTLSEKSNVSIGNTKELLMQLAASGQVTEKALKPVADLLATYAKIAGLSGKEAADKLLPSLDGSASSAARLNSQFHFLTLEQYKHIEALNKQGKVQEAIIYTADLLNKSLAGQTRELGTLEKLLESGKNLWSKWWDAAMNIGRPETVEDKIKNLQEKLSRAPTAAYRGDKPGRVNEAARAMDEESLRLLKKEQAAKETIVRENAKKIAEEEQKQKNYIAAGGLEKELSLNREFNNAKFENAVEFSKLTANEIGRLELDAALKIYSAKAEMDKKNIDERGVFASQNAKILNEKLIAIERDKQKKIADIQREAYIVESEAIRLLEEDARAAVNDRINAQEKLKASIMEVAAASRINFEADRDKLSLQMKMLGATQKEIELAQLKIDKARDLALLEREDLTPEARLLKEKNIEQIYNQKSVLAELNEQMRKAGQIHEAIFGNMEKALENFVKTGKASFADFARSVIQDLILIEMKWQATQIMKAGLNSLKGALSGGGGGLFSGITSFFGFADGGRPPVGVPSMVGENGPELFVPDQAGTIIPNGQMSSFMQPQPQTVINGPYIASMSAIDTQSATQFLAKNKMAVWSANMSASRSVPASR